nr:coagulation factor V-like [Loxodonta africana]
MNTMFNEKSTDHTTVSDFSKTTTPTEETTVHTTMYNMSESTIFSDASHTTDFGSSAAPSSPEKAFSSPAISEQTTNTFTKKSTDHSTISNSSEPRDSSRTSSSKKEDFLLPHQALVNPLSLLLVMDQYLPLTLPIHRKPSPRFPSSPSEVSSTLVVSEPTTITLTEKPTGYTTISDVSESTVSFDTSHTTGIGSSSVFSRLSHVLVNPLLLLVVIEKRPYLFLKDPLSTQPSRKSPYKHLPLTLPTTQKIQIPKKPQ